MGRGLTRADRRDLVAITGEAVKQDLVMKLTDLKTAFGQQIVADLHVSSEEEFADGLRMVLAIKNDPHNTDEEQAYLDEFSLHTLSRMATHVAGVTEAGSVAITSEVSNTLHIQAPEAPERGLLDRLLGRWPEE